MPTSRLPMGWKSRSLLTDLQKELGLIESFPETEFDFNLIPAMGRNADELAAGARYSRHG
jgi:hypothetical protein